MGLKLTIRLKAGREALFSMESPKREQISYVKTGVLIVDQVEPAILNGTAVRLDLPKNERIK